MVPVSKMAADQVTEQDKAKFLLLLNEYKPLECSCCNQFMGLVSRTTGNLFCSPDCRNENKAVADALSASPLPQSRNKLDEKSVERANSEPKTNGIDTDKSYKHVSSIHKHDEKAGSSPTTTTGGKRSYDAVDNKVGGSSASAVSSPNVTPRNRNDSPAITAAAQQKTEPESTSPIAGSSLRKTGGVNPFFKNIPSTKLGEEGGKTKSQVLDEDLGIDQDRRSPPAPGSRIVEKVEDVTESEARRVNQAPIEQAPPAAAATTSVTAPKRNPFANKTAAPPEEKKTAPPPAPAEQKRYMWKDFKYSPTLEDGAMVKASFMWNINLFQIVAETDEADLVVFQDEIAKFVKKSSPLTRAPVIDELVLAEYGGDWYRGRVTNMAEDGTFRVLFVDFGDARSGLKYTDMYPMSDEICQAPLFSAMVRLEGVKKLDKKVKAGKKLTEIVYSPLQLEMVDKIVMTEDKEDFKVFLWLGQDKHLNEVVADVLVQLEATNEGRPRTASSSSTEMEVEYDPIKAERAKLVPKFREDHALDEIDQVVDEVHNFRLWNEIGKENAVSAPDTEEFKVALLSAIKASFEGKLDRKLESLRSDVNAAITSTRLNFGGLAGMEMDLVASN